MFRFAVAFVFLVCCAVSQAGVSGWTNGYVSKNGTLWSEILPDKYANCISKRNAEGLRRVNFATASFECEKNSDGSNYAGISSDNKTVLESDAIAACRAIGGLLPTKLQLEQLGKEYKKLHGFHGGRPFLWTSAATKLDFRSEAECFYYNRNLDRKSVCNAGAWAFSPWKKPPATMVFENDLGAQVVCVANPAKKLTEPQPLPTMATVPNWDLESNFDLLRVKEPLPILGSISTTKTISFKQGAGINIDADLHLDCFNQNQCNMEYMRWNQIFSPRPEKICQCVGSHGNSES